MSCMAILMKGVIKGFNRRIGHLFVMKEREIEIEIGGPTDVVHVGHIGWDGPTTGSSGNGAPSWMGEFKTGPNFTSTSIGRGLGTPCETLPPLTSTPETTEGSVAPKKRRKKHRRSRSSSTSTSTTKTGGGGSSGASRSSRKRRSKTKVAEDSHSKQT